MLLTPEPSANQGRPLAPSLALQGHKSLFRVPMYREPNTTEPTERVYHARRPHRKSRAGCMNCKRRRVKCDETKPHCVRCQKHGIDCDYAAVQLRQNNAKGIISQFIEKYPRLVSPDSSGYSMSLLAVAETLDQLLQFNPSAPTGSSKPLAALHHFYHSTLSSVGTESTQAVMKGKMLELAFNTPYLMHGIIAVSTTHLCRISPDSSPYRLAEAYHWHQAITQYSYELACPVGLHNMDPLFSCCLLMTVHSFTLEEYAPRDSWVFSSDPAALNWLRLQGGLRHLLGLTHPHLCRSMWWHVFMESHNPDIPFDDHRPGRAGLLPPLADLCAIADHTTEDSNPYLWPLRMLCPLLSLDRRTPSANLPKYTTFMGRLMPEYFDALQRKEPPALVILAWWLALMCEVRSWWMDARVRSECVAICMYLEESEDASVLKLLEWPAEACGYLLKHVQEKAIFESVDLVLSSV